MSERKPNRTGRNLPMAVAIGVVLGGLVLVTLFTVKATFLAYVGVIVVAGALGTAARARRRAGSACR